MDKIAQLRKQLLAAYQQLLAIFKSEVVVVPSIVTPPVSVPVTAPTPTVQTDAQKLVAQAKACLGIPLWKGTGIDPTVACAISVNMVHVKAFGFPIGGGASTHDMYQVLLKNPLFRLTTTYAPGCIIISPTGYGKDPVDYPNGHVGIVCNYGICANDSNTGLWSEKYKDYNAWIAQFGTIEDYPTFLFERINQ